VAIIDQSYSRYLHNDCCQPRCIPLEPVQKSAHARDVLFVAHGDLSGGRGR
jgi:hypothetical protein